MADVDTKNFKDDPQVYSNCMKRKNSRNSLIPNFTENHYRFLKALLCVFSYFKGQSFHTDL